MRWFFCLSIFACMMFSFNACNRQSPEVLESLPGAGHHGAEHGHGEGHGETHGETHDEKGTHGEVAHGTSHSGEAAVTPAGSPTAGEAASQH